MHFATSLAILALFSAKLSTGDSYCNFKSLLNKMDAMKGNALQKRLFTSGGGAQLREMSGSSSINIAAHSDSSRGGKTAIYNGSVPPYTLSPQQWLYVVLTSTFVTCLIVADVIGVKIFEIPFPVKIFGHKSVEHSCGMLTFPITFLLGDIINEYYGPEATKTTVYLGLAMSVLVFICMNVAQALPFLDKPFNVTPSAFNMIFGSAKLMYVASITAYLIGQLLDIWLFGVFKRLTKGKMLWLRATGSTLISQLMDSFVVTYIAYSLGKTLTGQVPATMTEVWNISITGYGLKFFLSALITPLLYVLRDIMHNVFKLEPIPPEV